MAGTSIVPAAAPAAAPVTPDPVVAPAAAAPTAISDAAKPGDPPSAPAAGALPAADAPPVPPAVPPASPPAAPPAASAAPVVYDLQVPEGAQGLIDDHDLGFFKAAAEKQQWTPDEAKAAVGEFVALAQAQSARFLAETQADPTYGGANFAQTQRRAQAVINRFRPVGHPLHDAFQAFLAKGGAGNHLQAISILADIGASMGEDTLPTGKPTTVPTGEMADKFYDHPTSRALDAQLAKG